MKDYDPKNPDEFKQDVLPEVMPGGVVNNVPVTQETTKSDFSQMGLPETSDNAVVNNLPEKQVVPKVPFNQEYIPTFKASDERPRNVIPPSTPTEGSAPKPFDQVQIDPPPKDDLNIVPSDTGSMLKTGDFTSPNFRTGQSGWRVRSDGTAEFQSVTIAGVLLSTQGTFGGDGSDGALTLTSTTTTYDLAGAASYVKNFSSISFTGTGKVAFINSHANGTSVVFKCKGNFVGTATAPFIDCSGLGASGGAAVTSSVGVQTDGNNGTNGASLGQWYTQAGGKGRAVGPVAGAGGAVLAFGTTDTYYSTASANRLLKARYGDIIVGSGGGSGGVVEVAGGNNGGCTSGIGGKGGGAFVLEVAGSWNYTTANGISVAGAVGGNASGAGNRISAGGGGGGGGGYFLGLYTTLVANTGTINKSGGVGGSGKFDETGGDIAANTGPGGGGGGSVAVGTNGEVASNQADAGGTGGDGTSLVIQNSFY